MAASCPFSRVCLPALTRHASLALRQERLGVRPNLPGLAACKIQLRHACFTTLGRHDVSSTGHTEVASRCRLPTRGTRA